jgi:Flp pilus assembly protein TadG
VRLLGQFARDLRGVAAVEAALLAPILFAVGFACADAGNLLLERHRIKVGLALGARMIARAPDTTAIEPIAKNVAVTGQTAGGTARVPGWTTAQVSVAYRSIANGSGTYVGPATLRIVRITTTKPYTGLGLLRIVGQEGLTIEEAHEERWIG